MIFFLWGTLQIDDISIFRIINDLPNKSSTGFDDISMRLIKAIKTERIPALSCIFIQSLNTGIFPEKLKIAKVIPNHKKGAWNDISNYRPISLLPSISKILEKLIFKQLSTYLNEYKLLYDSQYGFRAGHSTELASIELIDRITQDLDKGKIPISIFLDLSKAFDTLDHVILLQKLNYYGIKSVELKLFQDYLQNRTQYVSYDKTNSDMYRISTGVPQGSILGHLLFIIYINDLCNASKLQGSPQKKKSSGRSHKNLNLAREQRNKMFTVGRARAIKKSKIFSLRHNKVYN